MTEQRTIDAKLAELDKLKRAPFVHFLGKQETAEEVGKFQYHVACSSDEEKMKETLAFSLAQYKIRLGFEANAIKIISIVRVPKNSAQCTVVYQPMRIKRS